MTFTVWHIIGACSTVAIIATVIATIRTRRKDIKKVAYMMDALEDGPDFLDQFDAELFDALVEKIIVDSNERLRFRLKNGLELLEQIERTKR